VSSSTLGCGQLTIMAQFHLFLPQMRMSFETVVDRARVAEASGFQGIAFMDHLAPPFAEQHDMWEGMAIASWVLAKTETLTVGHLVLCDALRHPAMLARQVTSLDHASGGRFELGVGSGSMPHELVTFGVTSNGPAGRIGRLAETLDIVTGLWTGESLSYSGEYFTLEQAQQKPIPTRPIPIIIGGTGRRTVELVARHAHWWNVPVNELDRIEARRGHIGDARISVQLMVAYIDDESRRAEITALVDRRFGDAAWRPSIVIGNRDELTEQFGALQDKGVERFYVWFIDFGSPGTVAAFGRDVIQAN
jgi:alkanesulfonate monooxygenase SsuD/methylene tetrahydromethanopterin reductase-like flavin-dependent oxidoreductase (luciferase family)